MSAWEAALLGLIQGLTEFLPVSSKAHFFLAGRCLGLFEARQGLFFVVLLHQASLAAILVYYGRRIVRTCRTDRSEILAVVLGSVPAAAAGFAFRSWFEALYVRPALQCAGLVATGLVLWGVSRAPRGRRRLAELSWPETLGVGAAQALALLPGVSRSGMTLSAGLLRGLTGGEAVRFSFYLGGCAIFGAGLVEAREAFQEGVTIRAGPLAAGLSAALAASLAGLWVLERVVDRGLLRIFAAYCLCVGLGGLAVTGFRT